MSKKGIFIVIDGIDGSGKTTIANFLKDYLKQRGYNPMSLSSPSDSENGRYLKDLLRKKDSNKIKPEKWVELFKENMDESQQAIRGALEEGKIVIIDRYYYSSLAYLLDPKQWQAYSELFLKPEIVFILDVDAKTGLKRVEEKYKKTKEKKAYFEKEKILKDVRKKFLALPQFLKDNIKIIDSNRSIKDVWFDVKKEVNALIDKK